MRKGQKTTAEIRLKMSIAKRGKKCSDEHRLNISLAQKGRKLSNEHKDNIRLAMLGKPSGMKGKIMSEETKRKISNAMSGENAPSWKGGISTINHLIRDGLEMRLWRNKVFERDNYICRKYETVGGKLHAHHICNFADYKEKRFDLDNGITLSEKAHKEFHKLFGIKNNTKEQLMKYLNYEYQG